ncbi:MAG: phosphate starvation-inducible protein PhoH, partial [Bacillota bacterium]|nr:phosphate starvation-inducible protein PhoH [Bacillota bacterium]
MSEIRLNVGPVVPATEVFGTLDSNLVIVEKSCNVIVTYRGDEIVIKGDQPDTAAKVITEMFKAAESGQVLDEQKVNYIITLANDGISYSQANIAKDVICFTHRGRPLKPKTIGQKEYVDAIKKNDITFGVGP